MMMRMMIMRIIDDVNVNDDWDEEECGVPWCEHIGTPLLQSSPGSPRQRRRTWSPHWSLHPALLALKQGPGFDYS